MRAVISETASFKAMLVAFRICNFITYSMVTGYQCIWHGRGYQAVTKCGAKNTREGLAWQRLMKGDFNATCVGVAAAVKHRLRLFDFNLLLCHTQSLQGVTHRQRTLPGQFSIFGRVTNWIMKA